MAALSRLGPACLATPPPPLPRSTDPSAAAAALTVARRLADRLTDLLPGWRRGWCHSRFMLPGPHDKSRQTQRAPRGGAVKPLIVSTCFPATAELLSVGGLYQRSHPGKD